MGQPWFTDRLVPTSAAKLPRWRQKASVWIIDRNAANWTQCHAAIGRQPSKPFISRTLDRFRPYGKRLVDLAAPVACSPAAVNPRAGYLKDGQLAADVSGLLLRFAIDIATIETRPRPVVGERRIEVRGDPWWLDNATIWEVLAQSSRGPIVIR